MTMQAKISLYPWQRAAIENPFQHFAMLAGVSGGKTYTGAQFSILQFINHPDKTGFIGANSYDQLSQATLRELFYWMDEYQIPYVIDRQPPKSWGGERRFRDYHNILSVFMGGATVHAFVRVLSEPDALRGIEFSWYWIDEARDTEQYTHDMLLARMRESDYIKGLITSTTNGEDWVYNRLVKAGPNQKIFGSMHVATIEAVKAGIITQNFYDILLKSYSPLMAAQELEAKHVNIFGGRAYYAASEKNRMGVAPWGDEIPDRDRSLIVGCDFNYSPAPCVWMVGQRGPGEWHDHVHWFGEVSKVEASAQDMALLLISRYPDFFYQFYGDATETRGTVSNAGRPSYDQISMLLSDYNCQFSIDVNQANPFVRDRVENHNSLLCNALGEVRVTYNPATCPLYDADLRIVGWKQSIGAKGKLDNGGNIQTTHASDGAGYALWKMFPPGKRGVEIFTQMSDVRRELRGAI